MNSRGLAGDEAKRILDDRRIGQDAAMAEPRRPAQPDMIAGVREKLGMIGRDLPVVGRMDDQRRHRRFGKLARTDEFVERAPGDAPDLIGDGRLRARAEIEVAAEISKDRASSLAPRSAPASMQRAAGCRRRNRQPR